ncbi:unnamed protein product [Coregonus sp. 'balchen']|nr:unnamed protein product [Coregonus sp. 'balchen']
MAASEKKCPLVTGLEGIGPLVRSVEETPEPITTVNKGNIPSWILRNGPGKFEFGKDIYNHWFDGMALMHSFHILDGEVTYTSRFLRSDSYMRNFEKVALCNVRELQYVVFIEQPIKLDLLKFMLFRIQGKSFHKVMTWEPQDDTIFNVVDRQTGEDLYDEELLQYFDLEFPQINYAHYNAWCHPGRFPSEPVFVSAPKATEEHDGVVMSVIVTPRTVNNNKN